MMAGDKSAHHVSSKNESVTPLNAKTSHKRKRDLDGSPLAISTPTPTKKAKKSQSLSSQSTPRVEKQSKEKRNKAEVESGLHKEKAKKESVASSNRGKAISPSRDEKITKSEKKSNRGKGKASRDDFASLEETTNIDEAENDADDNPDSKERQSGKSKGSKKSRSTDSASKEEDDSELGKNKFSGILSKFERSIKVKEAAKRKEGITNDAKSTGPITAEPVIAQGLEPLPQPEEAPEQVEKPTYSSLPGWLANPLRASAGERSKFSDLGIDPSLLRILEGNGYKEAFAVQSTVIPLLLQGPRRHPGDLCISAATGSGKTLSYVLPLVTALEPTLAPRMRGLIVVPTRELVKQARETCELCAAGSGLRIGSAVGNVAIKDEQRSLMRIDQVYGPEVSKLRQSVSLTGDDWTNFSLQDYIAEAGDLSESLPGYVHKVEPNVDILICTPGRLVDHIRYSKGFTLKHLEWLVIDEADRLLNESFQEWVDVVMNSLDVRKSTEAFGFSGKFMSDLGLPIQGKEPRKVILSATMTRDISKLNSLRLTNPKLVIIGSTDHAAVGEEENAIIPTHSDDQFTLPPTLKEYSVLVGDGSQKPLYLLRLLREHIKVDVERKASRVSAAKSESEDSSSDDSSSDDSSSDESSSDESDSESSEEDTSSSSDESDSSSDITSSEDEETTEDIPQGGPAATTVLIFTKSSESASRLSRLLSLLDPSLANRMGTIIKSNKSSASRKTLTAYRRGKISIIVATDRASRGLDLQSLTNVVNYDVPPSITTYVHRVGRTARAGKEGSAWTLVAHREGRWFVNDISKPDAKIIRSAKVERVGMKLDNMTDMKSRYKAALDALEQDVRASATVKSTKTKA